MNNSLKTQSFRNELKYLISEAMMAQLKQRVENLMPLDSHVQETGKYVIRSLYFDDYFDNCLQQIEDGTDPREKFRIRIYNFSDSKISLECKRKERDKTLKVSCGLNKSDALQLINGQILPNIEQQNPVLRKLTLSMMLSGYHPTVIVEYERTPFVYALGNVRVTFDTQIVSSSDFSLFFSPNIERRSVLPQGFHLMEVKYDDFLPSFIYDSLQMAELQRISFSKYCLSRKYII